MHMIHKFCHFFMLDSSGGNAFAVVTREESTREPILAESGYQAKVYPGTSSVDVQLGTPSHLLTRKGERCGSCRPLDTSRPSARREALTERPNYLAGGGKLLLVRGLRTRRLASPSAHTHIELGRHAVVNDSRHCRAAGISTSLQTFSPGIAVGFLDGGGQAHCQHHHGLASPHGRCDIQRAAYNER
jgi:hypothetical protein